MTQRHQRGSVLSFVVVGALLAIAVVGGIYLVKNQLNGNMPSFGGGDEVAVVEDDTDESTDGSADEGAAANGDGQTDQSTEQSTGDNDDAVTEDESTDSTVDDEAVDAPAQDEAGDDGAATTDDQDDMPQTGVETADELPQTGAGDSLYALVAVGALTSSVVAFRRSNNL